MTKKLILLGLLALSGCTTALQSDKIVAVKQRAFGIILGQSPANQTPEIKLGFSSTVWQMIPTSTNALNAPRYMDTFEIDQGINPFSTGIKENTGTGDVLVGGGTNDVSKAIVPSAYQPAPAKP